MKVASLCSGYGGLEMGVALVEPVEVIWHAEYEPAPAQVHAHHWPGAPNVGDITTADWSELEAPDLLTAGYPCQPFSTAGRRKGTGDDRHLWPHVASAVRVLRPRRVFLENVAGHLSLGFDVVLADLAAMGYHARWGCVRASDAGAPHRRERLFVVATDPGSAGAGWDDRAVPGEVQGRSSIDVRTPRDDRHASPDAEDVRHERCRGPRGRRHGSADGGDLAPNPDGEGARRPAQEQAGPLERRGVADDRLAPAWGPFEPAIRRWEHLTRPAPAPTDDRGRLNPPFVEWMMGLPAGHVTGHDLPRTAELKMLGNGVVPQAAAIAWRCLS